MKQSTILDNELYSSVIAKATWTLSTRGEFIEPYRRAPRLKQSVLKQDARLLKNCIGNIEKRIIIVQIKMLCVVSEKKSATLNVEL